MRSEVPWWIFAKNNIYVVLVLILRQARQKYRVKNAASSKTQKYDGSEWRVIIIIRVVCNKKNSTGLFDGSKGFSGRDQFLLATKIGGPMAIHKIGSNKPWDLGDLW